MMEKPEYLIALFKSVSHVMQAERILIQLGIPHKIIPIPKKISSDCGVSIRFLPEHRDSVVQALNGKTEITDIKQL